MLWSWPSNNSLSISHSPVIGQDGKIYFACYSDSLYALTSAGTLAWARNLGASVNSAPAAGLNGCVYVATTRDSLSRKFWCFNPDGSSPWSCDLTAEAEFASPAIGPDSTIYVGAGRYFYAIRPNGTLKWRDSLAAMVQVLPGSRQRVNALRRGWGKALLYRHRLGRALAQNYRRLELLLACG